MSECMESFYVMKCIDGEEVVVGTGSDAADACQRALDRIRAGEPDISVWGTKRGIIAFGNADGQLQATGL